MEFDFFDAMGPVRAPLDWCSKATPSTTIGLTRRERERLDGDKKKTQGQGLRHRHNPNQPNPGHNLTQARAKSEFGRLFKIKKRNGT